LDCVTPSESSEVLGVHDPGGLLAGQELPLAEAVDQSAPEPLRDPVEAAGRPRGQQEPCPAGDDRGEDDQPDRPHDRERDGTHPRSLADRLADLISRFPRLDCG